MLYISKMVMVIVCNLVCNCVHGDEHNDDDDNDDGVVFVCNRVAHNFEVC
jgi:hypothetical protein